MRVTFVLPGYAPRPIGGYLVVFHYANQLVWRGHQVTIVHASDPAVPRGVRRKARSTVRFLRRRRRYGSGRPPWFALEPAVRIRLTPDLRRRAFPDGDAVFATACTTAPAVAELGPRKGRKLYLIQHYEDWACGKKGVDATWRLPLYKVVSSRWLEEIGFSMGEGDRLTHIPYGVELDTFRVLTPPAERNPLRVGMLAHRQSWKGMGYGVAALEVVRETFPELEAVAFGAGPRLASLPGWITYVENPSRSELVSLYNSLAIFLHTSEREGWGLTGAEAVACGCALVASDSGGIRDYAHDKETALLVPPRDPQALAARTAELIANDTLRVRLACAGSERIQAFTWDRAASRMIELLEGLVLSA